MGPQLFNDVVKSEKEEASERFNRYLRILKLWRFFQIAVVSGLIFWTSARLPAVLDSRYVFNYHLVFLFGNAIIVALFVSFRNNDATNLTVDDDLCDVYENYSQNEPAPHPPPESDDCGDDEKQDVAATEATAAIEKATRQINRFQRTQSEKLKKEITVRPRPELRRSETDTRWKTSSFESSETEAEMEALSGEEFRRRVDAFIDEHWSNRKSKGRQFEEHENFQLPTLSNYTVKS